MRLHDLNITNTNGYFKHKNMFGAKIFATKSKERNIINKNVYIICIWTGNFFMVQFTASFYFASNYSICTATNKKMPIKFELFARFPPSTQSFAYFL